MWFYKYILSFLSVLTFCDARTFTSSDGIRKIQATVTAFNEKTKIVSILRNDGRVFKSKLSSFSLEDQKYVLNWFEGANENYLYIGKQYPGHLKMFLKILNAGGIGYGQTILLQQGLDPVVIGNGISPFLAWVDGYNKLENVFERFNVTKVNFDLIDDNWQANISYQTSRRITQNGGLTVIPSGNLYGLTSVGGPILYQQPQNIVLIGKNQNPNSVVILPRGPAPVFINPYGGGVRMNGTSVTNPSYSTLSRGQSQGVGISIRINK